MDKLCTGLCRCIYDILAFDFSGLQVEPSVFQNLAQSFATSYIILKSAHLASYFLRPTERLPYYSTIVTLCTPPPTIPQNLTTTNTMSLYIIECFSLSLAIKLLHSTSLQFRTQGLIYLSQLVNHNNSYEMNSSEFQFFQSLCTPVNYMLSFFNYTPLQKYSNI